MHWKKALLPFSTLAILCKPLTYYGKSLIEILFEVSRSDSRSALRTSEIALSAHLLLLGSTFDFVFVLVAVFILELALSSLHSWRSLVHLAAFGHSWQPLVGWLHLWHSTESLVGWLHLWHSTESLVGWLYLW